MLKKRVEEILVNNSQRVKMLNVSLERVRNLEEKGFISIPSGHNLYSGGKENKTIKKNSMFTALSNVPAS
jgi:hypothetical protein